MRRLGTFVCAFFALAALAAFVPGSARAQGGSYKPDPAFSAAMKTPLIGRPLSYAVLMREAPDCTKRNRFLREAEEDLAFYRRYLARNPNGEVKRREIDIAQQNLDREKQKPCKPGLEEKKRLAALAKLPKVMGTVAPMRSKLPSNATIKQRQDEIEKAIKKVDDTAYPGPAYDEVCDPHLYRRWLKNA